MPSKLISLPDPALRNRTKHEIAFKSVQNPYRSRGYPLRAQCWAAKAPTKVLPHHRASTGLFFIEAMRAEYAEHLDNFYALMTFEEIETDFPNVAKSLIG